MTSRKEVLELRDEIIHLANEVSTFAGVAGAASLWGWSCSLQRWAPLPVIFKSGVITCNFVYKGYNSVYI